MDDYVVDDSMFNDDTSMPEPVQKKKRKSEPDVSTEPARKKKGKNESSYGIRDFFTDERLHLAIGIIFCTAAVLSVIMCISFISHNAEDQVFTEGRTLAQIASEHIHNAGNGIGAKVAHFLLVDTLGIGSFVLAFYLLMLGLACMRLVKISFWSLSFRCLFTAAAVSLITGLFTLNSEATFPLGGYHGMYMNYFVMTYAGELGAFGLTVLLAGLLVAIFLKPIKASVAWIVSLFPKPKPQEAEEEEEDANDEFDVETTTDISDSFETQAARQSEPETTETAGDAGFSIDSDNVPVEEQEHIEPVRQGSEEPTSENGEESIIIVDDNPQSEEILPTSDTPAGEPEMIIRTTGPNSENNQDVIRDGDHIGLDTLYDPRAGHSTYVFPDTSLLENRNSEIIVDAAEQNANKQLIVKALHSYGIEISRIEATIGPTVTLYEIVPVEGMRISRIRALEDDIAMRIAANGIRIIAPMPGRGTIGIEVPNKKAQTVAIRRVLESQAFCNSTAALPLGLGATISNEIFIEDLAKLPHLLVAGATGQGKSVGLNCIIASLLYKKHPDELKFVLIDPKELEFTPYSRITNAFMAKLPDEEKAIITDPTKVVATLNSLCVEMDQRYKLLADAGVRDIKAYNERFIARRLNPENGHRFMPYIVLIVDEFADLMTTVGKEIVVPISRIAAKARAAGIHMIIATQRPSTDIINGTIKSNFPARIAFRVLSSIDSKTILDRPGAHRLIGRGDMLTLLNGQTERVQCAFIDTDEIDALCNHIADQPIFAAPYELPEPPAEGAEANFSGNTGTNEFANCCMFIAAQTQASITMLQRKFSIGFTKAGRYFDEMEKMGIIGPQNGAKPRNVLMTPDEVARILAEK